VAEMHGRMFRIVHLFFQFLSVFKSKNSVCAVRKGSLVLKNR
jgi:hypothetical protein